MPDEELKKRLEEQSKQLQEIQKGVRTIRRYFLWTFIISFVVIVLPLIGLLFIVPRFLKSYSNLGL